MPPANQITNREIYKEVCELKDMTLECQRGLKGHNGTPGVISRIDTLEKLIKVDLQHINEKIDELGKRNTKVDTPDPSVVRWPYLLDKFLAPILVALILFMITHYLFK